MIEDISFAGKKGDQVDFNFTITPNKVKVNNLNAFLRHLKFHLIVPEYEFKSKKARFDGSIKGDISGLEMIVGKESIPERFFGESDISFTGKLIDENLSLSSSVKINSVSTKGMSPNDIKFLLDYTNNELKFQNLR